MVYHFPLMHSASYILKPTSELFPLIFVTNATETDW